MFAKRLICLWIGAFGLAAGAFCQTYVSIVPSAEANSYIVPVGINKAGVIIGWFADDHLFPIFEPRFDRPGFVRGAKGTFTILDLSTIPIPCDCQQATYPSAINDAGVITGSYNSPPNLLSGGVFHGFVRDPEGNVTSFDPPGSQGTTPSSINSRGVITGYFYETFLSNGQVAYPVNHGFIRYENGTVIRFDPPGSVSTTASSINTKGDVTGSYNDANVFAPVVHGFVRRADGTFVSFDAPGSAGTQASSINEAGAITGSYTTADGRYYGFVRDPQGNFTSFNAGGNTFPVSINDGGAITGYYSDGGLPIAGQVSIRGFVRSPQGRITSFDPNDTEPALCAPVNGHPDVFPKSINREGVITGNCSFVNGWVRYP